MGKFREFSPWFLGSVVVLGSFFFGKKLGRFHHENDLEKKGAARRAAEEAKSISKIIRSPES